MLSVAQRHSLLIKDKEGSPNADEAKDSVDADATSTNDERHRFRGKAMWPLCLLTYSSI